MIFGGTVSYYCFGVSNTFCPTPGGGQFSYILNPGDKTSINYSVAPTWVWLPVE